MWRRFPILFVTCWLAAAPIRAQDTDTSATVSESGAWTLTVTERSKNALGTTPPLADYAWHFGRDDCANAGWISFTVALDDSVSFADKDVYLYTGDDCDQDPVDCTLVAAEAPSITGVASFDEVSVRSLFNLSASDCDATSSVSAKLWIALLGSEGVVDTDAGDFVERFSTPLTYDADPPEESLQITDVGVGDGSAQVRWEQVDDADVEGFAAVWVEDAACSAGATADLWQVSGRQTKVVYNGADTTSVRIDGLDNGATYAVAVAPLDAAGNAGALSAVHCVTPQQSMGMGDAMTTDGEYCFIATAVFGSYDHPDVVRLRAFRDAFLRRIPGGEALIQTYYRVGPRAAAFVSHHPAVTAAVRAALRAAAWLSVGAVALGPWGTSAALLLVGAGIFGIGIRKKRKPA